MLELLEPSEGDIVLDVGYGSGWTTALLAEIVSAKKQSQNKEELKQKGVKKEGRVYAIERVSELCEFGRKNISKYNFLERGIVECFCGNGIKGLKEKAPFDKILAGASAREVPGAWKEQLKINGRIVAPVGWSVWLIIKKSEKDFEEIEYPGFAFVPLIEE